jgi:hypothetical protein
MADSSCRVALSNERAARRKGAPANLDFATGLAYRAAGN